MTTRLTKLDIIGCPRIAPGMVALRPPCLNPRLVMRNRAIVTRAVLVCLVAAALPSSSVAVASAQIRQQPVRAQTPAALPAVKSLSFEGKLGQTLIKGVGTGTGTGGQEVVLRVELTAPAPCVERCGGKTVDGAPSGYMPVSLSTTDPAQFSPQRMFVSTGQTHGEINFMTVPVASPTQVTITAWSEGTPPRQANLTIQPPVLTSFSIDQANVVSGQAVKGTANFSGPPASANAVRFQVQTTNGQAVKVPATVALEVGKTAAEFAIQTLGVTQDRNAHVVAIYLDKTLPAALTVRAAVLTKFENDRPCCSNPILIELNGTPPPQGAVIQLTSANPNRLVVPPTVTIPPSERSITLSAQSIPGNDNESVRVTASYNGVTKRHSVYSPKIVKPDLVIRDIAFSDGFGNAITAAADGQPIKMCATVRAQREGEMNPNLDAPPSVLRITYRTPTGTGTSSGRTVDLPVVFTRDINLQYPPITHCISLPGLTEGTQTDITLIADVRDEVDESREGNNTEKVKISRP
jgi:hypothetical protein